MLSETVLIAVIELFGNPRILDFIEVNFIKPINFFANRFFATFHEKIQQRRTKKQLFISFFRALSFEEQKLVRELIFDGEAERDINDFPIEGSNSLRTRVFESIVNYTWEDSYTLQESVTVANRPVQIARRNGKRTKDLIYHFDGYSFELLPEYQNYWKKLYLKLPKNLRKRLEKN